MKKAWLVVLLCGLTLNLYAQEYANAQYEDVEEFRRNSITVGVLQGGGSLVGADFETLLSKRVGVQVGAGLIGFGGGINYHLKPSIRSSFISVQYWHQGVGESFAQNLVGPNYVYRSKKWFTAQAGFGFPLSRGPGLKADYVQPPVILTYAIGAYFPL